MGTWTGTDKEAETIFQKFYENEYEKLVRCATSYLKANSNTLHSLSRAEDVVQDLFAFAWEHRNKFLSREQPVGWLYKTLHFKVKEHLKEENRWISRLLRYEQFYVQPAEPYASLELELELKLELELGNLVSREDFDLLCKFYMAGYSYRELCEVTGLTKAALGTRIHRIKRKIRKNLKE